MGAPPGQLVAHDRGAACQTGRSCPSIDRGLAAVVAINAFEISEVAEGRASCPNALSKHLDEADAQLIELGAIQLASCGVGSDARCKQAFVGVDVACACDKSLVE